MYTKGVLVVGMAEIEGEKPYSNTEIKEGDITFEFDEKEWYTIVGATEADPTNPEEKTISNECPLFMAIKGKGVGETAQLDTPDGPVTYQILAIE